MNYIIAIGILVSAYYESMAYYRQIRKTCRRKHSADVSLKSYGDKLKKYVVTIGVLTLAANWVGLVIEIWALIMCIVAYITIRRYK